MEKLTSRSVLIEVLKKSGFYTKKSLGQNFLINGSVCEAIVNESKIKDSDIIVEIGPGLGTLTQYILEKGKDVLAIELDSKAIPILKENTMEFGELKVIENDFLKIDLAEEIKKVFPDYESREVKILANLPYYITTPIITKVLECNEFVTSLTIMVQKEVGERMIASHSTKAYGALTLFVNYHSEISKVCDVTQMDFLPPPKVESMVVKLNVKKEKELLGKEEKRYFALVKSGFNMRRKTILNSFLNAFGGNKELLKEVLLKCEYKENLRAENLSMDDYIKIVKKWSEIEDGFSSI